jgi:hypothetical protein
LTAPGFAAHRSPFPFLHVDLAKSLCKVYSGNSQCGTFKEGSGGKTSKGEETLTADMAVIRFFCYEFATRWKHWLVGFKKKPQRRMNTGIPAQNKSKSRLLT